MKSHTKSSITLPPAELRLVMSLMKRLGASSKVDVVRRGLSLLDETTQRNELRKAYALASAQVRKGAEKDLRDLDSLAAEGLDDYNEN